MVRTLLAAATAIAMISTAQAGDLGNRKVAQNSHASVAAVHNWNGLYLGIAGSWNEAGINYWDSNGATPAEIPGFRNMAIGGVIGLKYHASGTPWVVSADLGLDYLRMKHSATQVICDPCNPKWTNSQESKVNLLATALFGVGYAWNGFLITAKVGGAAADIEQITRLSALPLGESESKQSGYAFGPAYGAGIQYAITPNFSVAFDYLRYDLRLSKSSLNVTGIAPSSYANDSGLKGDKFTLTALVNL